MNLTWTRENRPRWDDDMDRLFTDADPYRRSGLGSSIVDRLSDEARERGLSVVDNVVPKTHPDPATVTP